VQAEKQNKIIRMSQQLFSGLPDAGRKTAALRLKFRTTMSSENLRVIDDKKLVMCDLLALQNNIAIVDARTEEHEKRRVAGFKTSQEERAAYSNDTELASNLRKKLKFSTALCDQISAAADEALKFYRKESTTEVGAVIDTFGSKDRITQVRRFEAFMGREWSGNPVEVAEEIDLDLQRLGAVKTGPDLAVLMTKADKLRLERSTHVAQNPKAVKAEKLRDGMTDAEYIAYIRRRLSSETQSRELQRLQDFIDEVRVEPLTLEQVRARIVLTCQKGVRSVDEKSDAAGVRHVAAATATSDQSADFQAFLAAKGGEVGQGGGGGGRGRGEQGFVGGFAPPSWRQQDGKEQDRGTPRRMGPGESFELCKTIAGFCRFGNDCMFQHGEDDQRPAAKKAKADFKASM
jgi:hypothetical protein